MSEPSKPLLVVDDDVGVQCQLRWAFEDLELVTAETRQGAIAQIRRHEPPVVTLDLGLPPDAQGTGEGFATLKEILSLAPNTKVIVITGNDDRENAVQAVGLGAYDFYQKPIDPDLLRLMVDRTFKLHELEQENQRLSRARSRDSALSGVIAVSEEMEQVRRTVEKIAPTNATTFLLGESGTGKELIAQALHGMSNRADGPFIAINCAAIPETLLESELFGYERGAFTGANKTTRGKIEFANNGTLFLDEVGDLPFSLQAKLLRFLQERVLERIGGREEIPVDVRVVCATNQDLYQLINKGLFREDLYYRLTELTVRIPPLRERQEDSVVIAWALLRRFAHEQGRRVPTLVPDAVRAIEQYQWPGNVRELENRIRRAVIMAENNQITPEDLELSAPETDTMPLNLRQMRDHAERTALNRALTHVDGNMSRAAELLGVTRPTLYTLLNKHDMRS